MKRVGDLFTATVTPPNSKIGYWSTKEPMPVVALINTLRDEVGCHTTDITDAIYDVDPFWTNRIKKSE